MKRVAMKPPQRVLARAILRSTKITDEGFDCFHVAGTTLLVRPSINVWQRHAAGESLKGRLVDVRIEHLLLDPGTQGARQVWSARMVGDVK